VRKKKTPIHIGAGNESMNPVEPDNSVIKDKDGKPYIPGSSLKGALRSWLESFLRGGGNEITGGNAPCLCVNEPCLGDNPENKEWLKEIKKKYKNNKDADRLVAEEIYRKLCPVCKVFGSQHFASKVKKETEKKYDFEQVAAGTEFDFHMTADNLDEENEKILKIIVKMLESGDFVVGGSVGLGRIRLYNTKIYKIDEKSLENYLFNGLSEEMRWQYV